MFLMPAGNVGLLDHDLRVDTRRQALQSLLVTATPMTPLCSPFGGLPFIEAGKARHDQRRTRLQPFRGLPFIEAAPATPAATTATGLQPFRGLPFIEAARPPVSSSAAPACSPFGGCPALRRVRGRRGRLHG